MMMSALEIYRAEFRPSEQLARPYGLELANSEQEALCL
jgi:hypothetical protein